MSAILKWSCFLHQIIILSIWWFCFFTYKEGLHILKRDDKMILYRPLDYLKKLIVLAVLLLSLLLLWSIYTLLCLISCLYYCSAWCSRPLGTLKVSWSKLSLFFWSWFSSFWPCTHRHTHLHTFSPGHFPPVFVYTHTWPGHIPCCSALTHTDTSTHSRVCPSHSLPLFPSSATSHTLAPLQWLFSPYIYSSLNCTHWHIISIWATSSWSSLSQLSAAPWVCFGLYSLLMLPSVVSWPLDRGSLSCVLALPPFHVLLFLCSTLSTRP